MSDEFVRRYGDPSWLTRPVQDQEDTWVLSPSDGNKSYEELELERRHVKMALPQSITANESVSWVFDNPLTILAGPDSTVEVIVKSTPWHLHRALLISHSSLFKLALSDHPKRRIDLNDYISFLPEDTFTKFVQWIYTSNFNVRGAPESIRAYDLGSQLGAVGFKNQAIHKFHDMNHSFCTMTPGVARMTFELDVDSGLRRLSVDTIALGFLTQELDFKETKWNEALGLKNVWSEIMSSMVRQYTQTWKSIPPEKYYEVGWFPFFASICTPPTARPKRSLPHQP